MNFCKCDEYGDYSGCFRHGDGTQWAKMREEKPCTTAVAHELAELKKPYAQEIEGLKSKLAETERLLELAKGHFEHLGEGFTTESLAHDEAKKEIDKLQDERAGNKDSIENLALINSELERDVEKLKGERCVCVNHADDREYVSVYISRAEKAECRIGTLNEELLFEIGERRDAETALKAKEDELSRCLKALDSEEGKHRLTQGELAEKDREIKRLEGLTKTS